MGNNFQAPSSQGTQVVAAQQQGQQVAKAVKPVDILKKNLNADSVQAQFRNALGKNAPSFVASIIDLYNTDASLQQCDPNKVICEALKAAVLKLPINRALGFAYVIAYNNNRKVKDPATGSERWQKVMEPTFQLGYKGYIQLAMRTGYYKTINADVVYEGELQTVNKLTGEVSFDGVRISDKVIGYFCYFELLNGFAKALFMTVEQMAQHAKRFSKGLSKEVTVEQLVALAAQPVQVESKTVGWLGNFHSMAMKTVIRLLLSKYGYLSIEMQNAMVDDQTGDTYEVRDGEIQRGANSREIVMDGANFEDVAAAPAPQIEAPVPEAPAVDPGF